MKHDELAGHFVGVLLVLAMLSCAAAFQAPMASEPDTTAFEEIAATAGSDASEPGPPPFTPYVAYSP